MPKGKKFDAAEKHFRQKEIEYQRTIRILRDKLKQCNQDKESILAEKLQLEDEIQSIQQRSISVLSPVEYDCDKNFRDRHYQSCKNGGHYVYDLEGTGIGTIVRVKCPVCGIEEDITDYEVW